MEELTQQVERLAETMKIMIARSEQLFKMQEEHSTLLSAVTESLKEVIDNLEVTDEALKRSLSEADQQIDDLAKVTAAQLQMFQAAQAAQSQQAQ